MMQKRILCTSVLSLATLVGGVSTVLAEPQFGMIDYEEMQKNMSLPSQGHIERLDPAIEKLIPQGAIVEVLGTGFDWTEGPVYDWRKKTLYFSDIPPNRVYQWNEKHKVVEFLNPSGYTGVIPRGGEPGSNGLTFDSAGRLVLAQHGDRRIARLEKDGSFTTLTQYYKFNRFNSPNDLVYHSNGDLYFTDPPYGLEGNNNDPKKELPFNGVYLLRANGKLELLERDLTFPNGIALSPDEKTLYIAVSDPQLPHIYSYDVKKDGTIDLKSKSLFFDATELRQAGGRGLPDGLKLDKDGNVWATGPGGVLVITPEGKHIGTIATGVATANCAWGGNGSTLFITADMFLLRVKTTARGIGPGL